MKPWEPPLDDEIADEVLVRLGREAGAVPPLNLLSIERAKEVLAGLNAGTLKADPDYRARLEEMIAAGSL